MKKINVTINHRVASVLQREGYIICNNSDYTLAFNFDSEWDAHPTKTARFVWGGAYTDVEFTGTECPVPVIYRAKEVLVGVYAGDLKTTTEAVIPCKESILCKTGITHDANLPTFRDQAAEAANRAEEAAERAEAAVGDLSTVLEALNEGGLT